MPIIKGDKKAYAAIINLHMIKDFEAKLQAISNKSRNCKVNDPLFGAGNDLDGFLRYGISTLYLYLAQMNNRELTDTELVKLTRTNFILNGE